MAVEESDARWSKIEAFAEVCLSVGSFGYGTGWESKVESFLQAVPLSELLKELENASQRYDLERLDLLSDVLKHVFHSRVGQKEIVHEKFVPSLIQGLAHFSPQIRSLACRQLRRIGISSFGQGEHSVIASALAGSLHDPETGIGVDATEALISFAKEGSSFRCIVWSSLQDETSPLAEKVDPSIACMRRLSVVTRVCARDESAFQEAWGNGLIKPLFDIIAGADILLQMNVLKLVPLISATQQGLEVLLQEKIIEHLGRLAGLVGTDQPDAFLGDEALRVMSQLSARTLQQGALDSSNTLSSLFLHAMRSRLTTDRASPAELFPTIEMVGAFAGEQPPLSLQLVVQTHSSDILAPWMRFATGLGDKTKVVGFGSVAAALRSGAVLAEQETGALYHKSSDDIEFSELLEESRVQPTVDERQAAAELGKDLFLAFGRALNERSRKFPREQVNAVETIELVVDVAMQPIDEQRCASFAVLRMVAAQDSEWGLRALYSCSAKVLDSLMDRTIDMNKEAKEWRFSVFEAVFHNPHRDAVLGSNRIESLKAFLRRGPYLGPESQPVPQVMLESS